MKHKILLAATALLSAVSVNAQTSYEAVDLSQTELNGTARFVGMGGAMGALGGDISTIATNPAGIGLFRRADIMVTAGFDNKRVSMGGYTESNTRARLNNAGIVIPFRLDEGALKYVNFAFNYQRRNSFYKDMGVAQLINGTSQLEQMWYQAQDGLDRGVNPDNMWVSGSNNPFRNPRIGWLSLLGTNGYLLEYDNQDGQYYVNDEHPYGPLDSDFNSRQRGGIDQSDINISFNFEDRFYVGATFGFYDVDYTKDTQYGEYYYMDNDPKERGYTLWSDNWIHGEGFDFKLGAIVRPFEESSFRLGFAFHTPIFYRLTLNTGSDLWSYVPDIYGDIGEEFISSYDNLSGNGVMERDFKLQTPWVFNLSAGYTVGSNVALGMEYEYEDYSSAKLKDYDGYELSLENSLSKSNLKGTHTLRLGAEVRVLPELSFRLGYNYVSSAYETAAYKELAYNSLSTDTDFTNSKSKNVITAGVGIKLTRDLYLDMAYKYYGQKGDFYAFDDLYLEPVKLDYNNHSFLATLGYRF